MTAPRSGDIWRYDYLWHWQREAGETEGRKPRPVALAAAVASEAGKTNMFLLPITSVSPAPGRAALQVPKSERRRAGLDGDMPLWIILDEYNHDLLEGSYYFNPSRRLGQFSSEFHKVALGAFVQIVKDKRAKKVPRTD